MLELGMIGDSESLLGFRLLGLRTRECKSREEAKAALSSLADCGVIFLIDEVFAMLEEEILEAEKRGYPVFVPLPGKAKTESVGQAKIRRNIEKAVGADIIGD